MNDDNSVFGVLWGGTVTIIGIIAGWFHKRIDSKLSENVFKEFKEANERDHQYHDKKLDKIESKIDAIYMNGKQGGR